MKLQSGVQYKDPSGNLFPLVVDALNLLEKSVESGIDNRSAGNFENNSIASELVNLEVSIAKRNNDSKLNSMEDKLAPDEGLLYVLPVQLWPTRSLLWQEGDQAVRWQYDLCPSPRPYWFRPVGWGAYDLCKVRAPRVGRGAWRRVWFTLGVPSNESLMSQSGVLQERFPQCWGKDSLARHLHQLGWRHPGETPSAVGEIGISRELVRGCASGCQMARYQVSLALGIITYAQLVMPEDGIELPVDKAIFSLPPEGKIGMYLKHFEAGYLLLTSDFFREVLDYYHVHIHQLVPNGVNKVVAFELLSRAVHLEPDLYVFHHFFRFARASTGNNYTFCVRQDRPTIVTDQRGSGRNRAQHYVWVNQHRVGALKHRVEPISDRAFTLFPVKEAIAKVLRSFYVVGGEFPEYILAGAGMSTSWRLRGKMPEFFSIVDGREHDIRFTDVLAKTYPGSIQYCEIPLIDRVLPSCAFHHDAFITRASAVQEEERRRDAEAGPSFEGIGEETCGIALTPGDISANVVLPRRLRPRRLAGSSGTSGFVPAQSPVINIADDASQGKDMETDQGGGARIGTHPVVENVAEEGSGESNPSLPVGPPPPPLDFRGFSRRGGTTALGPPPTGSGEAGHVASAGVFILRWSLTQGARLSSYQIALEFTQHACHSPADLVGSLRYAAAQSACFFGESANRLEQLLAANADRPSLQQELEVARAEIVKHQDSLRDLRSQVTLLQAAEKESAQLKEKLSVLGREKAELQNALAGMKSENEGLHIQLESAKRDAAEHDRVAQAKTQALEEAEADLSWLLTDGVVGVIDLVMECRDFGMGVHRLKEVCVAVGQAQGYSRAIKDVKMGKEIETEEEEPPLDLGLEVDDVVDAFMNVDYATAFKLGELGVPDLKALLDPSNVAGSSHP
ncbi:hypothetical protein L2E82_49640 [Cichorium intybus]|uniref:Uncharacterized protein n=1 Tax=Cichorium intybus TaxID=13427 RepID=A0ACB8Z111_CICIN|nr:hypothetical protein L2E82_49640 [Cichorium intybus]